MSGIFVQPIRKVTGEVSVPGDKSISHRAALFGGMAKGETRVLNFLPGEDCLSTLRCLEQLGVESERQGSEVWIRGQGMEHWQEPDDVLDVGNSGTTIRLMLGALAGREFSATLTGDASIRRRPMRRVVDPLQQMGAMIVGRQNGNYAPLTIAGGKLRAGTIRIPVASAQVKTAIILAGLNAQGETMVEEPALSRDHTERMLKAFGVDLKAEGTKVRVRGGAKLLGQKVSVPGDISSAAFFLVLGSLVSRGELLLPDVGVNPTRTGILEVLKAMGADIEYLNMRESTGELRADLRVRPSSLHGVEVGGEMIPRLIDEIPVLALAAALAEGETVIRDASELRVKETDRISTVVAGLKELGAKVEELPDGLRLQGGARLTGASLTSHGDHRLAMTWAIAGALSADGVSVEGSEAARISYPEFFRDLERVSRSLIK